MEKTFSRWLTLSSAQSKRRLVRVAWALAFGIYGILVAYLLVSALNVNIPHDHYYFQASNFLRGNLTVDNITGWMPDVVTVNGHKYLPLGPLPAVLSMPLVVLFGDSYRQAYLVYILVALSVWVAWRIVQKLRVESTSTRLWLVVLFFLSTVYFSLAVQDGGAWYTAHIATCLFLFLGINEALGKRHSALLGLYLGLAAACRFTALFTFPFFALPLITHPDSVIGDSSTPVATPRIPIAASMRRLLLFGLGLAVPVGLIFAFNFARFGNLLDSGYGSAVLGGNGTLEQARAYGLFSLAHLPKNLYYFFLAVPEPYGPGIVSNPSSSPVLIYPYLRPSPWGMSIFLTTPAVIYAIRPRLRRPLVAACWAAIGLCAIPIFTYYGIGWVQFGYRYALDFMPFVWLLIVLALRRQSFSIDKPNPALWLIVIGCVINLWGAYWMPDLYGKEFHPPDSRVEPAANDRLAIWCNSSANPPNLDVWGVGSDSQGFRLVMFPFSDLAVAGSAGQTKDIPEHGSVSVTVDGSNNFTVVWTASASGQPAFQKQFHCDFSR